MKLTIYLLPIFLQVLFITTPTTANNIRIVPPPKRLVDHNRAMLITEPEKIVIVVGESATEPELYAAERLQTLIKRRFQTTVPIVKVSNIPQETSVKILMGLPENNSALRAVCERHGININYDSSSIKNDEYTLEILDADQSVAIVGSNERSVIYGAQTFFKLITREGKCLRIPVVSIHDWPSIAWRGGRGINDATANDFDGWLWSGFNYVRCKPDENGDWEAVQKAIKEAHKRGFFVYGYRSTAVSPPDFEKVIQDYRKLIECGVDGLWMSFDDAGPGVNTLSLMEKVIALGKEYGITGRKIAITPPIGDYNNIDTSFNRERVRIPGMEEATWFFTRVPCAGDLYTARSIGIKTPPAWWHNWPRIEGGITNGWYSGGTFRSNKKPPYVEVPPLTWGWHHPNYEQIRQCAKYTDTILPCTKGNPMYKAAPLGFFAWDPMQHDFVATREAIYEATFGPECVHLMLQYDNIHHLLKTYFTHPSAGTSFADHFPARLKSTADRKDVEKLISLLEQLADEISKRAPIGSILSPEILETDFLEPIREEPKIARVLISLAFPEEWWPEYEGKLLQLLAEGKKSLAKNLAKEKGAILEKQLSDIEEKLAPFLEMTKYLSFWWERAEAHSAGDLAKAVTLFHNRMEAIVNLEELIEKCKSVQCPNSGIAATQVKPEQLLPTIKRQGDWTASLYSKDGFSAIHMGFPAQKDSKTGDYCEVSFRMNVPKDGKKYALQFLLCVSPAGSPHVGYDRRLGLRLIQIQCDGKTIWEEDALVAGIRKTPWRTLELTDIFGEHEFKIRVVDRVAFRAYPTSNWVGDSGETKGWTPVDADTYHMSILIGGVQMVSIPTP